MVKQYIIQETQKLHNSGYRNLRVRESALKTEMPGLACEAQELACGVLSCAQAQMQRQRGCAASHPAGSPGYD